jgi:hypothetical protein
MLRRFFDYADKVFNLSESLSKITDTRSKPQIDTQSILMGSFIMQLTRRGSLNALDSELRLSKTQQSIPGQGRPDPVEAG